MKNQSKKVNKTQLAVYLIWYIVFSVLVLYLSISGVEEILDFSKDFDEAIFNWQLGAILDLQIVEPNTKCPENYNNDLLQYTWQGTADGCYCSQEQLVFLGKCSQKQCSGTKVRKFPPQTFTEFATNDGETQFKICVQRSNYNYLFNAIDQAGKCNNENEKLCGQNSETQFCVPESEKCPITNLEITEKDGESSFEPAEIIENFLNSGYSLQIQRGNQNTNQFLPLVQITAASSQGVCQQNYKNNLDQNSPQYPLYQAQNCDDSLDTRWRELQLSINQNSYFLINDLYSKTENYLPLFKQTYDVQPQNDVKYKLYQRSYNQLAISCHQYLTDFYEQNESFSKIETNMIMTLIFCSIFVGFLWIVQVFFMFQRRVLKKTVKYILFSVKFLLWLLALLFTIFTQSQYYSLYEFNHNIISNSCLDSINQQIFSQTITHIHSSYYFIIASLFLLFMLTDNILLELILISCCQTNNQSCIRKMKKFYLEDTQQTNSNRYSQELSLDTTENLNFNTNNNIQNQQLMQQIQQDNELTENPNSNNKNIRKNQIKQKSAKKELNLKKNIIEEKKIN
ncbi:hypothetical protein PPERSA_09195 [Pseudocohnilembus persalinus]|uniref:Transmembrane protein n=1 Tax=Pseudocohnilembus persalinus TaxID=266149 RepID=A0A0V0QMB4_PSEPJ|nr:hypothetical protein PPERSA_09195 [Pseudocohnilembus persalinus]|eukprot:KRX03287.1 hypothetical protein PPERSA_09195 [Pseudocohnilembus persalinus]